MTSEGSPVSRRQFLIGLSAAAAATAFLAACGEDADGTETGAGASGASTGTPETSTSTGEAASATATSGGAQPVSDGVFPVSVSHKYGTTEVAAEPKRVVSLGYSDQDAILAVGVVPVATRYWFGEEPGAVFPWARDRVGGELPEVLTMTGGALDFEKVASLRPDLIVAVYSGITEEEYGTLSEIAPVVAQSPDRKSTRLNSSH